MFVEVGTVEETGGGMESFILVSKDLKPLLFNMVPIKSLLFVDKFSKVKLTLSKANLTSSNPASC